jgi:hypothetical protein
MFRMQWMILCLFMCSPFLLVRSSLAVEECTGDDYARLGEFAEKTTGYQITEYVSLKPKQAYRKIQRTVGTWEKMMSCRDVVGSGFLHFYEKGNDSMRRAMSILSFGSPKTVTICLL